MAVDRPSGGGLPPAIVYMTARDPLASEGNSYADTSRKAG
jgi:acetyl esterase/lipase